MWRPYKDYVGVVREALIEARRFTERAEAYLKKGETSTGSKEAAAMKRSSMDLTRALVKVRGRD